MTHVLHLAPVSRDGEWRDGRLHPASLRTEGFVHASPDDEPTLLAVANAFYRDIGEPLICYVLDVETLDVDVRWEEPSPAPPPGVAPQTPFPHIYGAIPRQAVVERRYLRRSPGQDAFTTVETRSATAEALDLLPHPEGGWFRETWRSGVTVAPDGFPGERATATGIHFLLGPGEISRWHRVRSDEVWVFNRGGPLTLALGGTGRRPVRHRSFTLGADLAAGQVMQAVVPAGTWQAAWPDTDEETLTSCFVSPGFDFADFELAAEPPEEGR